MEDERHKPDLKIVEGGASNVVDLTARQAPPAGDSTVRLPGAHMPATMFQTEVVQLIACTNCHSPSFRLAQDRRVICAVCSIQIMSLRWHDVNLSTVIPKVPA